MMDEGSLISSTALFYYFAVDNEASARMATLKTLEQCQSRIKKENLTPALYPSVIVNITNKNWEQFKSLKGKKVPLTESELGWKISDDVDLGVWKQFLKEADTEEFLAVIWSKVLGFSDDDVAHGLGVTTGTIRHRVGRGLRLLGDLKMY